jgi:maleate isomerase
MSEKQYGWRSRIGLLTPEINTVSEVEFNRYKPPGVTVHAARMPLPDPIDVDALAEMNEDVDRAADAVAKVSPDVIVYGVTAGSFFRGRDYDVELEDRIESRTGVPSVTTARAVRRALDAVGIESVAIATPYLGVLNDRLVDFLEAYGYSVDAIRGEEFETSDQYGTSTPESVYRHAKALDSPGVDGIFVSGMEYHGTPVIEALEADLGKPVITAHQASLWDALRTAGVGYRDISLGELFDE